LENRPREVIHERVKQKPIARGVKKKLLKNVDDDAEEEEGKGVTLTQTAPTLDPPPRDAIKEDHSLPRQI
jgi:hypothetical protein